MATQYNIDITGSLTNTNGVLSGFSAGNYAELNKILNPNANIFEIVFKFNSNNIANEQIIFQVGDLSTSIGLYNLEIFNSKLWVEYDRNNAQFWYMEGITTLDSNTDYWVKFTGENGSFNLYISTDGINYTSDASIFGDYLINNTSYYGVIGINSDYTQWAFDGTIDLNESYIKINGSYFWRGVSSVTTIQLRRDTAANWTSVNPVLLEGEVGLELDTGKSKVGDGSTAWNSLAYDKASTALQSINSSDVTTALGYTPVNKAGDTMTGNLTTSGILATSNAMRIVHSDITRDGSTPSVSSYKLLNFVDNGSTPLRFGAVQSAVYTNGGVETGIFVFKNQVANASERISINYNNLGDVYTYAPACETNNSIVTTVAKSKTSNGYYKLGNGLIIQWGTVSATTNTTGQVTLPTAFTSKNYQVAYGSDTNLSIGTTSQTTTNFDWKKTSTSASINWIAIGY